MNISSSAGAAALVARRRRSGAALALTALLAAFDPPALAQTGAETPPEHVRSALETALLPLSIDTVAVPRELGVQPGAGGGITIVNDTIMIVDMKGALFMADAKGDSFARLATPPIPNNAEGYDNFAPKPKLVGPFSVNSGFVVHDLKSRKEPGGIRLFVSYERYLGGLNTTTLAVSSILLGEKELQPLGPWQDVYQGQPLIAEWYSGIAGGGRMVLSGDVLYLTAGDYNLDTVFMHSRPEAQMPDSDFGKILRIDLRTNAKSHVSIGHRNPQGLTITASGAMYSTEHGPQGGDELNLIVQGKNYGWPVETYGTHYGSYDWPASGADLGGSFEQPVFAWVPSIGVSNLIEVANLHPAWNGDLLVGSLRAQSLYRLRRDVDGRVVYSEPIALGQRLRDIGTLSDGTLVLWTDNAQLMFLSVDRAKLAANQRPPQ